MKGVKMADTYDVENQGRPEPTPAVTTCLIEKPEVDKKVKTKVDNMKKTGTGGGLDSKLTEIDVLVLQIIGKDSPVIDGLGVADSFQEEAQGEEISIEPLGGEEVTMKSDINECASFQGPVKSKKRVVVVNNEEDKTNIQHLKKQKLKLEMEQIKMHTVESQLRQHKLKLEILEKEKMLNIPSSQFTKDIAASEFPKYDSQCCFESVQEIVLLNNN
ncbi:hypothetical protein C0J52_19259 [Blattella germanica]|nr:hypothetical protein C0J52_19259 [Blattella germanica]